MSSCCPSSLPGPLADSAFASFLKRSEVSQASVNSSFCLSRIFNFVLQCENCAVESILFLNWLSLNCYLCLIYYTTLHSASQFNSSHHTIQSISSYYCSESGRSPKSTWTCSSQTCHSDWSISPCSTSNVRCCHPPIAVPHSCVPNLI